MFPTKWRKSTYSQGQSNCVEISRTAGGIAVRDAAHRRRGPLRFPAREWRAFLADLKSGRL